MTGAYLFETKVKGDVNERDLLRQLRFDLQTMMYLVALYKLRDSIEDAKLRRYMGSIRGVRYNVVRRPLSGGKGSIVQHKATKKQPAETKKEFYQRLSGIIEDSPQDFFFRWKVEITPDEVMEFEKRTLVPLLESLCDWWAWVSNPKRLEHGPFASSGGHVNRLHWQHPHGVYNPIDEGYSGDVDGYIESGSEVGLHRVDDLFPELK